MSKIGKIVFLPAVLVLFFASCNKHAQVLKSNDLDYKLEKAKEYYDKGAYAKAQPLFEELITRYKGSRSIDEIYYLYAMCHFNLQGYLVAGFHFKHIHDAYSLSKYAEECLYMYARSYYMLSSDIPLDQTYTYKAIDAFQLFANSYPQSEKLVDANRSIDELRRKLELKDLRAADLYFKQKHYKAAAVSYRNLLKDYPDTEDAERILYSIIKSYYKFAENSIVSRQSERFREAAEAYNTFVRKYPESKYLEEVESIAQDIQERLIN